MPPERGGRLGSGCTRDGGSLPNRSRGIRRRVGNEAVPERCREESQEFGETKGGFSCLLSC